jgi:hypothetical protein
LGRPLEITFQECARNFRIFKCSAIRTMEIMRVRKRMEARVYNRLAKQARRHEGSMRTDHPSGRRQETSERTAHSSQTVHNVKIRGYACIAVDNLFTILSFARIVSAFEMNSIQRRRVTCYRERFERFQPLQSLGEGQLSESWPSRWDMKTPTTRHGWLAIRSECEVVARAEPTISDGEPGFRRPRPRGKGKH